MSSAASLLEEIRAGNARVAELQAIARKHPKDRHVLANLRSTQRRVTDLESEWLGLCNREHLRVCKYRLVSNFGSGYAARSMAKSVLEFQELFSQIYDSLINGPKRRARLSSSAFSGTAFDFAYTYEGSLGIVLTIPETRNLLEAEFDRSVKTFNQVLAVGDEFDVRDIAKTLGEAVVKKVYDWAHANFVSGYSVDVVFTGREGSVGQLLSRDALGKIADVIGKTTDLEKREFGVVGSLVAIDVVRKRFRFVDPDGDDFAGGVSLDFDVLRQWAVNKTYKATISVEETVHYATERSDKSYTLLDLKDID